MRKRWKKSMALLLTSAMLLTGAGTITAFAGSDTGDKKQEQPAKKDDDKSKKEEKAVTAKPQAGTYKEAQKVSLTAAQKEAQIYYTVDGKTPTAKSQKYDAKKPIEVSKSVTIKAIAVGKDGKTSEAVSFKYVIDKNAKEESTPAKGSEEKAKAEETTTPTQSAEEKTLAEISLKAECNVDDKIADALKNVTSATEGVKGVEATSENTDPEAVFEAGKSYTINFAVTADDGYTWGEDKTALKAVLNEDITASCTAIEGKTATFTATLTIPEEQKKTIEEVSLIVVYEVGDPVQEAFGRTASLTDGVDKVETTVASVSETDKITAGASYEVTCKVTAAEGYQWNATAADNKAVLNDVASKDCSVEGDVATFTFTVTIPTTTVTPSPTVTNTPKPTTTNTPKPTATNTPKPTKKPTKMITSVSVEGLTASERGAKPDMKVKRVGSGGYTVDDVYWIDGNSSARMSKSDVFRANTKYTAYVVLKAKDGYAFDTDALAKDSQNKNTDAEIDGTGSYVLSSNKNSITIARAWQTEPGVTASTTNNSITGLSASYVPGATISFTMNGASNEEKDANERYVPVNYEIGGKTYSAWEANEKVTTSKTKQIKISTAGTYTLKANFQKQTYDAAQKKWIDVSGATDSRSVSIRVSSTSPTTTTRPTTTVSRSATTTPTRAANSSSATGAKTGDETPVGVMLSLFLAAGAAIAVIIYRKRKA